MGIDPALGRDTKAMQLYLLALVLPLAAAGFDAQQMMQMMQMVNAAKGRGSQQQLLVQFKAMEEKRKQEMEKKKIEMEAKEREENMMAQWKGWEQRMKMSSNFEHLGYEIMEMK